jgi:hypothetical protein
MLHPSRSWVFADLLRPLIASHNRTLKALRILKSRDWRRLADLARSLARADAVLFLILARCLIASQFSIRLFLARSLASSGFL